MAISTKILPEVMLKASMLRRLTDYMRVVCETASFSECVLDSIGSPSIHVLTRHSSDQAETIGANWLIQQETWEKVALRSEASGWQG